MVSNVSPATATPKINKSFVHMAHLSSDRACAQDGYLEHPHRAILTEICGGTVVGFWVVLGLGDIGHAIS
jgi:hypothetical protein